MTISGRFAAATGSAPLVELWPSGLTRHRTASELVHDELSPRWLTRTGGGDGRALSAQSDARMPTHASGETADARPSPRDATSSASSSSTSGDATAAPFEEPRRERGRGVRSLGEPRDRRPVGLRRARRQRDDDRSAHRVGAFAEQSGARPPPRHARARGGHRVQSARRRVPLHGRRRVRRVRRRLGPRHRLRRAPSGGRSAATRGAIAATGADTSETRGGSARRGRGAGPLRSVPRRVAFLLGAFLSTVGWRRNSTSTPSPRSPPWRAAGNARTTRASRTSRPSPTSSRRRRRRLRRRVARESSPSPSPSARRRRRRARAKSSAAPLAAPSPRLAAFLAAGRRHPLRHRGGAAEAHRRHLRRDTRGARRGRDRARGEPNARSRRFAGRSGRRRTRTPSDTVGTVAPPAAPLDRRRPRGRVVGSGAVGCRASHRGAVGCGCARRWWRECWRRRGSSRRRRAPRSGSRLGPGRAAGGGGNGEEEAEEALEEGKLRGCAEVWRLRAYVDEELLEALARGGE